MKTMKKIMSLLLMMILSSMMTVLTAGAVDVNEVNEGYYTSIVGPATNESNATKLGLGSNNMGSDVTSQYATENGNTYVDICRTGAALDKKNFIYPLEFGSNDYAFDLGSGEYIVQTKVRWTQPAEGLSKPNNVFFFRMEPQGGGVTYAISNSGYSNTGFGVGDDVADYIYVGNSIAKLSDGTTNASLKLQNNAWYTVRVIYNLDEEADTLVSRFEIDDANGNNLITTAETTTPCTDPVKFYRIYNNIFVQESEGSHMALDDFMIVKTAKKPVIVTYDEAKGTVSYNNAKAVSGEKTPVTYNENAVFTISPKTGYKVDTVLVNGEEATVAEDGTVTLATVTDAQEIAVTFQDASREYIAGPVDNTIIMLGTGESNISDITCQYGTEGGNTFVKASRVAHTSSSKNFIYPYTYGSDDFAFDLGSGEYVVEAKMRWIQPAELKNPSKAYHFSMQTNLVVYNISSTSYANNAGFGVGDDTIDYIFCGDAKVKLKDSSTNATLDLQNGAWYTFRIICNLDEENDTLVSRLEIDDANGTNLITTAETTTECTQPAKFNRIYTNMFQQDPANTESVDFDIDDFSIYKVLEEESEPEDASVTVTYNEGGSVTYNNETVTSGEGVTVAYNEDATFGIVANEGYEIESILVNNETVAVKDSIVLEKVTVDQTLAVTFKKKAAVAPSVDSEIVPDYVFGSENGGSQVAYFIINPGYGYTFTDGIAKLYEIGNTASEQNPLKLESNQMLSDYANQNWDGRYGVRIHGTGLTVGNNYVLAPYWIAQNNEGNTVIIDPVGQGDTEDYTFTFGTNK
ncbi:MAG: hypothetical protein E7399_04475 [Ruminococcaceae bacterium]|nr:hypothetical protein [Oscillospiraceae bacterium]